MSELAILDRVQVYEILGRWALTEFPEFRFDKKYSKHVVGVFSGNRPWGWPLEHERHECVYFARDCTGTVKVGVSYNPSVRMQQIGGGCRLLLMIHGCARPHEQALHRLLEPDSVMPEWFQGDLTESLVKFLLDAAAKKASAA